MECRFRILGPIEVELDTGSRADVPRGRALSLLSLLLVHRGAIVHLDRVVDELWDGAVPRNARNAVHVVAWRLRRAVGDGVIVSEGGGYAVALAPAALDADRFEERFRQGRDELARGHPRDAAHTLRQALALWHGPALADVRSEGFAQPEIARLEDLRLACLSERVDADLACGGHAEVAGELEALVHEHPLRERLRGQLMLALYREGRQAEALAAYGDARRALVDGLGIEPSPQLRELESAILRHDVPPPSPSPERSADREPGTLEARRRVTCVFFQLGPPERIALLDSEALRSILERYHAAVRAVCARHGGSVAELGSDAALAVFGAPVAHEDDALRALRAAAELGARSERLPVALGTRTGVCTGDVVEPRGGAGAGRMIGEAVVEAERLGRSATLGEIRIAGSTWPLVRHAASASELPDGGFLLRALDHDAPPIERRLDRSLVGREQEVGRIGDLVMRVTAQRAPQVLTVVGEPGIGKSRLVAELATIVGEHGTLLTGRCPAYGDGVTYRPLREIVVQAAGGRTLDELTASLDIPLWVGRRVAAAVGLEDGDADDEAGVALVRLIDALAGVGPLAIVVEDAHWAEPALIDLLLDAVAQLTDAPLLLVLVTRPDVFEDRPSWARRALDGIVVALGPLSDAASRALLAQLTDDRLDADEQRRIARTAGGNPLFLEQLLAYVGERRATDELPPALHALLAARLDRLDAAERSALALGAVAGDGFGPESVHALAAGLNRAEVVQACDRLVSRDLLVPGAGETLHFRHALVRDVAYASLAKSARVRLHRAFADWLAERERDLEDPDARIGFHLETACGFAVEIDGEVPAELAAEAGHRLGAAARVANDRGDLAGEIGLLDRALALLGGGNADGAELLPALASALFEAGSFARAEEVAERAVQASASRGLPLAHARAAVERERIELCCRPETFSVARSVVICERALETLRGGGDELGLARAAHLMCMLSWLQGDVAATSAHAERMLVHARGAGSGSDAATAIARIASLVVEGPCPVPEGLTRCDALGREVAGQPGAALTVLGCRAVLLAMTGGYEQARSDMARARAGLVELQLGGAPAGATRGRAASRGARATDLALLDAMAETLAGDPAAAERALLDADAIASSVGDRRYRAMACVDLANAVLAQGRRADAAAAVARIDTLPLPGDPEWVTKRHTARALLAVQRDDLESGVAEASAAVAASRGSGLILYHANAQRTLAEALWAAGRRDDAAMSVRQALALDEAKGNVAAAAATRRRFPSLTPV